MNNNRIARKLYRFNMRGELFSSIKGQYSFGVYITYNNPGPFIHSYYFNIVEKNRKPLDKINFNEWLITSIHNKPYFNREIIFFCYIHASGQTGMIETGGRTIDYNLNNGLDAMARLLSNLFMHFHGLSFYQNREGVQEAFAALEKKRDWNAWRLNLKWMDTRM